MEQLCPLHSEIKMKKGNQPESSRGAAGSVTRQRRRGLTPQPWSPLLPPPRTPGPRTQSWAPRASRLCEPSALGSAVGTPRGRREQRSLWGRFFFFCDRGRWEADYQRPAGSGWKATDTKVVAGSAPGVEGRSPWTLRKAVCALLEMAHLNRTSSFLILFHVGCRGPRP